MVSRTPAEAVEEYRRPLQRALSCITTGVLSVDSLSNQNPYSPAEYPHVLLLNNGDPTALAGAASLAITVQQTYSIVEPHDTDRRGSAVDTRSYHYAIQHGTEEVIAYHWHPTGLGSVTSPHLHLGRAIIGTSVQIGRRHLHRVHFPTNQVSLASMIWLVISEFDVQPLRADWRDVLAQIGY